MAWLRGRGHRGVLPDRHPVGGVQVLSRHLYATWSMECGWRQAQEGDPHGWESRCPETLLSTCEWKSESQGGRDRHGRPAAVPLATVLNLLTALPSAHWSPETRLAPCSQRDLKPLVPKGRALRRRGLLLPDHGFFSPRIQLGAEGWSRRS